MLGRLSNGIGLYHEHSEDLPLVDLQIILHTGSCEDPAGRAGLARLTARMIRMGTRHYRPSEVEEAIARLGASLSIDVGAHFVRFHGSVIERNVVPFFSLIAELLNAPAFRARDLAWLKRKTVAELVAARDHDQALVSRHFRAALFGDHPLGKSSSGTELSVKSIQRADLVRFYREHFTGHNAHVGAAGAIDADTLRRLAEAHFGGWRSEPAPKTRLPAVRSPRGRRIRIVDKPERVQTQLYIGTLGARSRDDDLIPLLVGNTVFGGTFTSRLMHEVRSVRGWSYGASSRVGYDHHREAWLMATAPAAADAADCARLELDLLERWVERGVTAKETTFARGYLAKSHCFDVDTAAKRLEQQVDETLLHLPRGFYDRYVDRIKSVSRQQASDAVRRRISPRDVCIVAVATADEIQKSFEALPGVSSLETVAYDVD